jgi:hypothetical protein
MAASECEVKYKSASQLREIGIADKVEKYFSFLSETSGMKGSIATKIKNAFSARLFIEPGDLNPYKVFEDVDSFIHFLSRGVFSSKEELSKTSDAGLTDEINGYIKAFSDVSVGILNNDDIEFLNHNTDMIEHYSVARSFLTYSVKLASAEKWAENPLVKLLTLTPFTFDRGAKFSSNPLIKPAYDELLKLNSAVNRMTNMSLDKKEKLLLRAQEIGLQDEDIGSIVKVMEYIGSLEKTERATVEEENSLIKSTLSKRFDLVDDAFITKAKDIWSEYCKFNYGSAVGEMLFDLPEGYHPLDKKYSDGFLPMFVTSNVQKARLGKMIIATGNINTENEFIKDAMDAARVFDVTEVNGRPDIEWKWKERYFPHNRVFANDSELGKNEGYRSVQETNALNKSNEKTPEEIEFVNSLNFNIENIRHKTNLSATRMFTSFLIGISGYRGDADMTKDILKSDRQHPVYEDWVAAGGKNGNRSNHIVIKDYIDRMVARWDKPIDIQEQRNSSLFKKTMMSAVGLMSTLPLAGSAINNLAGAASQAANELGIKDTFSLMASWIVEHPQGSTEYLIKEEVKKSQIFEAHGIKLKKHSSIEYNIQNGEVSGIHRVIDELANIGIKTGQIVGEHGLLSPFALTLEAVKASLDFASSKVHVKGIENISSGIGKILEVGKDQIWSMSGSEDAILNVEAAVKYNMLSNAIRLRNIGLTSSGKSIMNEATTKAFIKEYQESTLTKSEVMDKWKHIAGDFSEHAKPFWSWLDLKDATSKMDITKAVVQQAYGMFRPVGLFLAQGAIRGVAQGVSSNVPVRRRLGFATIQLLLTALQISNRDEGLDIAIVSQVGLMSPAINSLTTVETMFKVFSGVPVKENEFKSMYNTFQRTVGGIPFGGTIGRVTEGWLGDSNAEFIRGLENPSNISKGLKNLYNDLSDPFYMVKSMITMVHLNDESINRLNSYRKEYSSNGIPMLSSLTAMNKPMKQMIDISRMGMDVVGAKLSDDAKLSNNLLRDAQKNLTTLVMSGLGLNSYIKLDAVEANSKAQARKAKIKNDAKYKTGWEGLFK